MTAVNTTVFKDIPPYVMAAGSDGAKPHGLNTEGLRRRGFTPDTLTALKRAYKSLYRSGLTLEQARVALAEQAAGEPAVRLLLDFLDRSTRGIIR